MTHYLCLTPLQQHIIDVNYPQLILLQKFEVLTLVNVKIIVFQYVTPCSLIESVIISE
jgi:predicted PP-loop superfamily ATPase